MSVAVSCVSHDGGPAAKISPDGATMIRGDPVTDQPKGGSMTGAAEGVLTKVAIEAIKPGFTWLVKWWGSRSLLIVGQERSGKTNFYRYLRYGITGRYGEETKITNEPHNSGMFVVTIGETDRALQLTVRKSTDMPGQIGPRESAKRVIRERPDIVVVMLDLTTPQTGSPNGAFGTWYEQFCSNLFELSADDDDLRSKPVAILTLLNKHDVFRISHNQAVFQRIVSDLRAALERWLTIRLGTRITGFQFLPMCAVYDPDDPARCDQRLIGYALEQIGLALQ
jgi:hypothetical protein